MAKYQIILVENNRLMLERLSSVIKNARDFELVSRYTNANDALGQSMVFASNLILLDVDDSENMQSVKLFREQFPNNTILCLSTQWNAQAAGQMVRAGADGYLIKPFTADELKKALETFGNNNANKDNKTIAFFSPKGKSGKTTLISNLAISLARQTQEEVAIIDADLQFGDMAVFFDLKPSSTIVEAVRDIEFLSPITLKSYFATINKNVYALCGTKRPEFAEQIKIKSFIEMIKMARSLFNYILIDLPPAFTAISTAAAEEADKVYLVSMDNGGFEIKHMQRALEIFCDAWPDNYKEKVGTIFTRIEPCTKDAQRELANILDYPVEAILPNEYRLVSSAANDGKMAVDVKPDSKLGESIEMLSDIICNKNYMRWEKR